MLCLKIWKNQPGKYFFISSKDRKGKWVDHPFRRGQFGEIKEFLQNNLDKDLYWCPHGFSKPRRLEKYAELPKLLWADLDEVDPRELDDIHLMPTAAWESSPGRYACVWELTDFMHKDLNRRLTHHIKADPGGWDLTQVLRVPRTKNYKYDAAPMVRLLWLDGPVYNAAKIMKYLPAEKKAKETDQAMKIWKRYESKMTPFLRRELLKGRPKVGNRSEVIWKLVNELLEIGCSKDEVYELIRVSPWNKFSSRRDGEKQLMREIEKATKKHLAVIDDRPGKDDSTFEEEEDEDEEPPHKFLGVSMADVEEEEMDWVWYPFLARGQMTILEGDPGLGKSYLAQMICGAIVDGRKLPSPKKTLEAVKGKIAYFDIENSAGTVTKKRLTNNGILNLKDYFQDEQAFSIDDPDTLERVYEAIERLRPTVVVFDTLNTYIGKADTHKSSETQQAMGTFVQIAKRYDCAVLVLRHLTKSTKEKALYRGQGSIAFTGMARIVITVGQHPDEQDVRVMAVTKINVAKAPKAMTWTINSLPDTLKQTDRSVFKWGDWCELTADDIVSVAPIKAEGGDKEAEAIAAITSLIESGKKRHEEIARACEARGISRKTVERVLGGGDFIKTKEKGKGHKAQSAVYTLPVKSKKKTVDEDDDKN